MTSSFSVARQWRNTIPLWYRYWTSSADIGSTSKLRSAHSGNHGRVSRAHPFGRSCRDGSCQSGWHLRLADPEECHQGPIIHRVRQFLLAIHPGPFTHSQTPSPAHQKGGSVEMG